MIEKSVIYISSEDVNIEDNEKNILYFKRWFKFDVNQMKLIKSKKSLITDKNNNKYIFENLAINLKIK